LKDYLAKTKKVVLHGVIFEIKKISVEDHLAGFNVLMKLREAYSKPDRPKDNPEQSSEDLKKMKKFMRDFICAGVVKPKITMKDPPGEDIHVDDVLNDLDLAQDLCAEIIEYSFGKKNSIRSN
jgi:hypothetical protein